MENELFKRKLPVKGVSMPAKRQPKFFAIRQNPLYFVNCFDCEWDL